VLRAQAVHRGAGAGELRAFAEHVGAPAARDHRPVGLVAVHGDGLAPAAGGDAGVEAGAADVLQEGLEGQHVVERAGLGHVAAVEQGMDAHGGHAFFLRAQHHRLQVVDVAVHVAVGEQADEVERARFAVRAGLGAGDDLPPRLALPDRAVGDRVGDQRRALRIDLAGTEALWPTSELPMSSSEGIPTAVPWACRVMLGHSANRRSRVGLRAASIALPSACFGMP